MFKFLIRRVLLGAFIVLAGLFITYSVMRLLPTSYVESLARRLAAAPNSKPFGEWIAQLNTVYGFDQSVPAGFLRWLGYAARGEFGDSWAFNVPVTEHFKNTVGYSVILQASALLFQLFIAIPLGIAAARRQYGKTDFAVSAAALIGISLPSFFFALALRYVFAVKLNWLDAYGVVGRNHMFLSAWGKTGDIAAHFILPCLTLMIVSVGGLTRYTRANMLEVLNEDYIRTARAKGLPERKVIYGHALRNTLIPLVSYFNRLLPSMISGFLVIETIFAIPGMGYAGYNAIIRGDIPFTMFFMLFSLTLTQVGLIISDLLYAVVDPRVRIR